MPDQAGKRTGHFMKKLIPSHPRSLRQWGQSLALMVIALPAFIAFMGLATDIGNLYYNSYKLQTADDASVLAGANCLPSGSCGGTCGTGSTGRCTPSDTAKYYATALNGVATGEITGTTNPTPSTLQMTMSRNVPYYFARFVGVTQGTVNVSAEAQAGPLGTAYDVFPVGIQYCGTPTSSSCFTQYQTYNLSSGGVAPGNWGPISTAAASQVSSCPSNPAGCLPVDTGCSRIKDVAYNLAATSAQARINAALSNPTYSGDTPSSYVAGDPRVVTVPLVNWNSPNIHGTSGELNVYGFAEFFLSGVVKGSGCSGGDPIISGQFINAVANGTNYHRRHR
jgi:hypothetical protein